VLDRRQPAPVRYLLGVPRYMFGAAIRATFDTGQALFTGRDPARIFKNELAWWDLAGFVYGKHVYHIEQCFRNLTRGRETLGTPSAAVATSHGSSSQLPSDKAP
jgi:hypothetical protein